MTADRIFNFSPSEFAFGFESCQKCYYDKKVYGIALRTPFPSIFSKFDSLQKNYLSLFLTLALFLPLSIISIIFEFIAVILKKGGILRIVIQKI